MKSFQYLAPIAPFRYAAPSSLDALLDLLQAHGPKAKLIAGGTDLMIALKQRRVGPEVVIDLNGLRPTFRGVSLEGGVLRIGSLTTYTELESSPLVAKFARAVRVAAAQVGTHQIRNLGTVGGNLANASPAADLAPPLIALSAKVHLVSRRGERVIPVEEFFAGVKKTVISADEFVSSVELPARERVSSYWMRFAKRNENALSVVSVAVASEMRGEEFGESRVALGSVAPTPILAPKSSSALQGSRATAETIEKAAALARDESKPITDVRAGAEYRRRLVYVLTKRTISKMLEAAS